jgi:hypothetical protein
MQTFDYVGLQFSLCLNVRTGICGSRPRALTPNKNPEPTGYWQSDNWQSDKNPTNLTVLRPQIHAGIRFSWPSFQHGLPQPIRTLSLYPQDTATERTPRVAFDFN